MERKQSQTQTDILVCTCSSAEHQIVLTHFEDTAFVYCQIHLSAFGFWRRVKAGLKYIFGYKCRYGQWDEFIFKPEHAAKLHQLADVLTQLNSDLEPSTESKD